MHLGAGIRIAHYANRVTIMNVREILAALAFGLFVVGMLTACTATPAPAAPVPAAQMVAPVVPSVTVPPPPPVAEVAPTVAPAPRVVPTVKTAPRAKTTPKIVKPKAKAAPVSPGVAALRACMAQTGQTANQCRAQAAAGLAS